MRYPLEYIGEEEVHPLYYRYINSILSKNLRYTITELEELKLTHWGLKSAAKNIYSKYAYNINLLKDPQAIFSIPWLAKNFNLKNIILTRHPAAFAGSFMLRNWPFDLSFLLEQRNLMKNVLFPFEKEMIRFQNSNKDKLEFCIIVWNIINHVIMEYKARFPNWYYITHENISLNPKKEFSKMFNYIEMEINPDVLDFLEKTQKENYIPTETVKIVRNSKKNIMSWRERLTPEQIDRIYEGTHKISSNYYQDDDWK